MCSIFPDIKLWPKFPCKKTDIFKYNTKCMPSVLAGSVISFSKYHLPVECNCGQENQASSSIPLAEASL